MKKENPEQNEEHALVAAAKLLSRGVIAVCDPVTKVCVPAFQTHFETRYKKRFPKHASKLFVLDLFLWFLVGALTVTAIFLRTILPAIPLPETVTIASREHYTATSGEPITITFRFHNETSGEIADAEAILSLPSQLALLSSSPAAIEDGSELRFSFGTVAPGESQDFSLTAVPYAPTGTVIPVTAELQFWKEAAAQPARVPVRAQLRIIDADLALSLAIAQPLRLFARGQRNEVRVSYRNTSPRTFEALRITLALPAGFTATSPVSYDVGRIVPDAGGTFIVPVVFTGIPKDAPPIFIAKAEINDNGLRVIQTAHLNPPQEKSGFVLTQEIENPLGTVHPGDVVTVVVHYANRGTLQESVTIDNVRLHLRTDEHTVAVPTKGDAAPLGMLAPGQFGEWRTEWRIKSPITKNDVVGDAAPMFTAIASADFEYFGDEMVAEAEPVSLPITTELGIRGIARYRLAGEQVGTGPVPPIVGERTTFRLLLTATNGAGAADAIVVTATLPENVEWTGKASVTEGEAIDYLPSSRTVRWRIGAMPRFTEEGVATASFELAITPTAEQSGAAADLLGSVAIEGRDAATGAKVKSLGPTITTEQAVK